MRVAKVVENTITLNYLLSMNSVSILYSLIFHHRDFN